MSDLLGAEAGSTVMLTYLIAMETADVVLVGTDYPGGVVLPEAEVTKVVVLHTAGSAGFV